jgi:hypothetical protein
MLNGLSVVQELGRSGTLPFSSFFASSKPANAPFAGLFTQWVVSVAFMLGPPGGDVYLFMISCELCFLFLPLFAISNGLWVVSSYSSALINTLVSFGLLLIYTPLFRSKRDWAAAWNPPFKAPKLVIVSFFLSNVFLIVVPLVPPPKEARKGYERLAYWVCQLLLPCFQC